MRHHILTLLTALALGSTGWGQAKPAQLKLPSQLKPLSQPQAVFTRFQTLSDQGKLKSAEARKLFTSEATRFAQIPGLGPMTKPDSLQFYGTGRAVTRVQVLDGKIPLADFYFYLAQSDGVWKMSAARGFALSEIIAAAREELRAKPQLTEQEKLELANMDLTLSLDRDLRIYLRQHLAEFDKLRLLFARKSKETEAAMRKLGLTRVRPSEGQNIDFVIGGLVDNTVGYIYSPTNKPPRISTEEFIWVEKITDKWYLYRTT